MWLRHKSLLPRTLLCVLAAMLSAAARAAPRYAFQVGDHLVYERRVLVYGLDAASPTGHEHGGSPLHPDTRLTENLMSAGVQQLQYWCLAVDDGKATLLGELTDAVEGRGLCRGGAVMTVDERGRCTLPAEFAVRLDEFAPLLEPFPEFYDAFRPGSEWTTAPDPLGRTLACIERVPAVDEPRLIPVEYDVREQPGLDALLRRDARGRFRFDMERSALAERQETIVDLRAGRRTEVSLKLYLKGTVPAGWAQRRMEESERFAQVVRLQQRYRDQLGARPERADAILQDLGRFWTELGLWMRNREESPLQRLLNFERRRLQEQLAGLQAEAKLALAWKAKAPEWGAGADGSTGEGVAADANLHTAVEFLWSVADETSVRMLARLPALLAEAEAGSVVCVLMDGKSDSLDAARRLCGDRVRQQALAARPPELAGVRLPVIVVRDVSGGVRRVAFGPRVGLERLMGE